MRAFAVDQTGPISTDPLRLVEMELPVPGEREVRIAVRACGVCRTDLHLVEGDLPPRRHLVVPGHEVVGLVDAVGPGCVRFKEGDRIGVPWLSSTCGTCCFCAQTGRENLCASSRYTGWDQDGGYAECVIALEDYVYTLPDRFDDVEAAPLLCAGIIGYRALRRSSIRSGGRLGVYGFGGSAHLASQLAMAEGARVHVFTRSAAARRLALELGAESANDPRDPPPERLDSAILFAPAGDLVPLALDALDKAGTLAIAGIYLSEIPAISYDKHLFGERTVTSVTANTRSDGEEFLRAAATFGLKVFTQSYPLSDAPRALVDLASGQVRGAAVLVADL